MLILPKNTKITVVGDIHEHSNHFFKLLNQIKPNKNNILISIGDIYGKGYGEIEAEKITKKLIEMNKEGIAFAVRGNHEQGRLSNQKSECLNWFSTCPYSLPIRFSNQSQVLIIHAGVTPHFTDYDLQHNIQCLYLRNIDNKGNFIPINKKETGKPWHKYYDGRFGYIISGHDSQGDGIPKFYSYSCNIDTRCYETGKLTAIVYGENGREEIITINDKPARRKQ